MDSGSKFLAFLALAGCSRDPAPTPTAAPAPEVATVAPAAPPTGETWSYNPTGKRDPYRSFVRTPPQIGPCTSEFSARVQCWALEQLSLTGIVWGDQPQVLLEDPEGQGHVVGLDSYVGNHWGRITSIASDHVVVTEEYLDGQERLVTLQTRLELTPRG